MAHCPEHAHGRGRHVELAVQGHERLPVATSVGVRENTSRTRGSTSDRGICSPCICVQSRVEVVRWHGKVGLLDGKGVQLSCATSVSSLFLKHDDCSFCTVSSGVGAFLGKAHAHLPRTVFHGTHPETPPRRHLGLLRPPTRLLPQGQTRNI